EPVLIQNRLDARMRPRDGPVVEDQVVADAAADRQAFALDDGIIRLIQLVLPAYYESALRIHGCRMSGVRCQTSVVRLQVVSLLATGYWLLPTGLHGAK